MIFFIITILAMDCDALSLQVFRGLCIASGIEVGIEVAIEAIALTAILSGIAYA